MHIFRYSPKKSFPFHETSVAMGNFDGLHIGHKKVIELAKPSQEQGRFGVVTFDPHPRKFFFPDDYSFKLMSKAARDHELKQMGLDVLVEIPFDEEISKLGPQIFVEEVLHKYFGFRKLVVGEDFKFGYRRQGDVKLLKTVAESFGIRVIIASMVSNQGSAISSTAIRQSLSNGQPEKAAEMLGRWYSIVGKVLHGDKRGRKLGYPTINLDLSDILIPKFGIYSAFVNILTGPHQGVHNAAVSIGTRPTYGKQKPNLEAHLLDFSGNLYTTEVAVSLIKFQRPELKFNSESILVAQMKEDCLIAKETLEKIQKDTAV